MIKGNTDFYHKHIQTNIAKLEERKDKYVHYRIDFLKQFCEPIQQKIRAIELEISKYKNMRDTQQEVIQKQPDILSLKNQIQNYKHTHQYFNSRLDEYQKKNFELIQYNKDLIKQIEKMRKYVKGGIQEIGFQLPKIVKSRLKTVNQQNSNKQLQSRSFVLPSIRSYPQIQSQDDQQSSKFTKVKKIMSISQKIQRNRVVGSSGRIVSQTQNKQGNTISQNVVLQNRQENLEKKKQAIQLRERITKFNKTQSLFNDCFETKKNSVQRSVSQLQSKLIKNRQQFLNTCQAISSKQNKVSFEQFNKLSSDEILTLFISFVWLNKKIRSQFAQKRRLIMDFIGRLPKSKQGYLLDKSQ